MKTLLILGHMGLGDHFLTNGMIRFLSKFFDISLISKKMYKNTLLDMFDDVKNITLISVNNDMEGIHFFNSFYSCYDEILKFGNFEKNFMLNCKYYDESFYVQSKIPYDIRWSFFKTPLIQLKEPPKKKYIFIHEDPSRNLLINKEKIYNRYEFILPDNKSNFFSYYNIIKESEEIHCMDSSFAAYIDHLPDLKNKKKYIHRYVRKTNLNPYYKNDWIIYE